MMLLSKIIADYDLTQKILSLLTFIVLPIKAGRTCSQKRKRKMGKVSRFLTELKAYSMRGGEKTWKKKETQKRMKGKNLFYCATRVKIRSFLFPFCENNFIASGLRLFFPHPLSIITGIFNLKKSDNCRVITKKMSS